MERTNL